MIRWQRLQGIQNPTHWSGYGLFRWRVQLCRCSFSYSLRVCFWVFESNLKSRLMWDQVLNVVWFRFLLEVDTNSSVWAVPVKRCHRISGLPTASFTIQCADWIQKDGNTCFHPCSHIHRRRQDVGDGNRCICHCCSDYGDNDSTPACHDAQHGAVACSLGVALCCSYLPLQQEL